MDATVHEIDLDLDDLQLPPDLSWTNEREALAVKLWTDGMSGTEIAMNLWFGHNRNPVMGKLRRLGAFTLERKTPVIEHRQALVAPEREHTHPSSYPDTIAPLVTRTRRRGRIRVFEPATIKRMSEEDKKSASAIAFELGCSIGTVNNALNNKERGPNSRFASTPLHGRPANMPAFDHPALMGKRTIYPTTVKMPPPGLRVLKSGFNSSKIGKRISKGKWKGFEVYTLTLEERATCPTSCKHWRSCFGNGMHFANRIPAGPEFERRLQNDVAELSALHPEGFAVRLHVLGDFMSVEYVDLWRQMLDRHPPMHAFGFSARWETATDPIAAALVRLVMERWDRFAIRFSDAPIDECSTVSIEHPLGKPVDAVLCPEQTGRTANCVTCGFCWNSRKRLALLQH